MKASREGVMLKFDAPHGSAWRGRDLALLALVCALYVGARMWRLDATCLWFDEIFGVHAAAWHGWGEGLRFVALDLIHPPLFYALLKVWAGAFGTGSVWWLRLFPVVASALTVVPFVLLARELRVGARVVNVALLLAAVSGILIKYAQELRMYSLLLLLATCSLWLFARLCNADAQRHNDNAHEHNAARDDAKRARHGVDVRRDHEDTHERADVRGDARRDHDDARGHADVRRATFALFAANLLLVYTHYFGWLVVALELIFVALSVRGKLKRFAASVAWLAACFAPWAWMVARASAATAGAGFEQNLGWAQRPRLMEIFEPYLALHEPFRAQQQSNEPVVLTANALFALFIFAPPIIALCWRVFARRADAGDDADRAGASVDNADTQPHQTRSSTQTRGASHDAHDDNARHASPDDEHAMRASFDSERTPRASFNDASTSFNGASNDVGSRFALVFLLFFSFAPVVVAFALAQVLPQSIWGVRHLIIVAPAYLLLAALALERVRAPWLAVLLKLMLGCWLALAAVVALTRRSPAPVWCAFETLALQAARDEASARRDVNDSRKAANKRGDVDDSSVARRDAEASHGGVAASRGDVDDSRDAGKLYALEDLSAYQSWYALRAAGAGGLLRVAVVRDVPGVVEDRAFFLPRGFAEVSVESFEAAMREDHFWIIVRGAAWDDESELMKTLRGRGYEIERRYELDASGQKTFVALARKR
jgi:hypothetical protein